MCNIKNMTNINQISFQYKTGNTNIEKMTATGLQVPGIKQFKEIGEPYCIYCKFKILRCKTVRIKDSKSDNWYSQSNQKNMKRNKKMQVY